MDGVVARHKKRKTFISSSRPSRASVQNSYLDFFISQLVVKSLFPGIQEGGKLGL
jgi:hypothetical protein